MAMFFWFLACIAVTAGSVWLIYLVNYDSASGDKDGQRVAKFTALGFGLLIFGALSGMSSCLIGSHLL